MARLDDLIGQRFGHLTVIGRAENRRSPSGSCCVVWTCKCDCGNTKEVRANELRSGSTLSCGCYRKQKHLTHGMRKTRLYNIWSNMLQRCTNTRHPAFLDYGGRGINVCPEWSGSFESFEKWALANGYTDNLSIDRINNDLGYSPENCHWATPKQQACNRRPRRKAVIA